MKVNLEQVCKRYISEWVFKNINYSWQGPGVHAILGANGSGKSTLLRMIAGMQTISKGRISYELDGKVVVADQIFNHVSYCAPAMDIIEEMSLREFLSFHFSFKKIRKGWTVDNIISALGMQAVQHKYIADYSSGMKQRAKLAQAFFADTPLLLLDEPCSNLDLPGVTLYQDWLRSLAHDRLVIVASNDEREYLEARTMLDIQAYK